MSLSTVSIVVGIVGSVLAIVVAGLAIAEKLFGWKSVKEAIEKSRNHARRKSSKQIVSSLPQKARHTARQGMTVGEQTRPAGRIPALRDTGSARHPTLEDKLEDRAGSGSGQGALRQKILSACWTALYHWKGTFAEAVRLIGAQDECFPLGNVVVSLEASDYSVPQALQVDRARLIQDVQQKIGELGEYPYDGPCVRLTECHALPQDSSEEKHLHLTLGPLKWFDFVMTNQRFGDPEVTKLFTDNRSVAEFVNFDALAQERDVGSSQLSNILTIFLTATTADGFLIYSQRSGRVATQRHSLTSAVSENLHPVKDGVFGARGPESLFLAAARGIKEELSPLLAPRVPSRDIYLLGVEFNLIEYNPGLLFYLPLSLTRADVEYALVESAGKDQQENQGRVLFVHLDRLSSIEAVLSERNWYPAGKASVIRTLEFLSSGSSVGMSMAQFAANGAPRP